MNADQLLSMHLELVAADAERWLGLFADDAVVELPYAGQLGAPTRLEGRNAVREYFVRALADFDGLAFSGARRHKAADPDLALLEVHGSARIKSTGRAYEQDYVMLARARGGRIVLYREYFNPLVVATAFGLEARP